MVEAGTRTAEEGSLRKSTFSRFVDGAISGLISGATLQPLQVIKTSMQVSPIDKPEDHSHQSKTFQKIMGKARHQHYELLSFTEAVYLIYHREGFMGYYRGFLPSMLKNTLNAGTYFSTLHFFKEAMRRSTDMTDPKINVLASALARAIQSTLCNPLIVIKTRFEVLGF